MRRLLSHITTLAVVLATCGCSISTETGSTPGRHLRMEWRAGSVSSFQAELTIDGPDATGKQQHEVVSGLATLTVGAVDSRGNASIEVRVVDYPPYESTTPILFQVDVAPDGRVTANPDGHAYDLTNLYQMFPLLPPGGVQVGDLWHETYDMPDAVGGVPLHFSVDASYARDETVNGTTAVVIQAHLSCSFDLTFLYSKLNGSVPPGFPADLTTHEVGTFVDDDMFWYAPEQHALVKSSGTKQTQYVLDYSSPSTRELYGRFNVLVNEALTFTSTRQKWPAQPVSHR